MYANAQAFVYNRTTGRARLPGVSGVHGYNTRTSILSFVRKQLSELRQSRVMGAKGQVVVDSHELERQVFESNQPIGIDKLACHLMPEVTTLVGDTLIQPRNLKNGFTPSVAALLAAGHPALGHSQLCQGGAQPSRVVDRRLVAECQQMMQAHVNAHGWTGMRLLVLFRQVVFESNRYSVLVE